MNEQIQLRRLKPDDLAFMMKLVRDPDTTRYIPSLITDESVMASWIGQLDDSKHEYIVELKETDQAIGECSLALMRDAGEIGIMLLPSYWNKGYGTEVIRKLQQIAETLGLHKLTALKETGNSAMVHIFEKLGFQKDAVACFLEMPEEDEQAEPEPQWMTQYEKMISLPGSGE